MTITPRAIVQPTHIPPALNPMHLTPDRSGLFEIDVTEWELILRTGSNAFLQGPQRALRAAVTALEPCLRSPQYTASGRRWSLPPDAAGTLFLEHVEECSTEQQQALVDWLDAAVRPVQVITMTERPLFDLVERGALLSSLYYRLNTIHLILGSDS